MSKEGPQTAHEFFQLGVSLLSQKQPQPAEEIFWKALKAGLNNPEIFTNLAASLIQQCKFLEATQLIENCPYHDAPTPGLMLNYGICLSKLRRTQNAEQVLKSAASISPNNAAILSALAGVYRDSRNYQKSIDCLIRALKLSPHNGDIQSNLGYTLIGLGDEKKGFSLIESRLTRASSPIEAPQPLKNLKKWNGQKITKNSRLFVFSEQGFGDTIQFVRFLNYAVDLFAEVILLTTTRLRSILEASFPRIAVTDRPDELIPLSEDLCCPLLSLPHALFEIKSWQKLPKNDPSYLKLDRKDSRKPSNATRIGISWVSETKWKDDSWSLNDLQLLSLTQTPNIEWISLLPNTTPPENSNIHVALCPESTFETTGQLILELDLVITIDTAVAHLAAALGKETWLLNRWESDWRWGYPPSESSSWYPTLRIFNQTSARSWSSPLEEIKTALEKKFS